MSKPQFDINSSKIENETTDWFFRIF